MSGATTNEAKPVWYRRVLTIPNLGSAIAAIALFLVGISTWDSNAGVATSSVAAGITAGIVWWILSRLTAGTSLESAIENTALLSSIPVDTKGPAATLNDTESLDRYTALLREIEGKTTGRILLVSSPGPGQGASTVALNLAIAATEAGRRVMLVDADPSPNGLGRFLSTGNTPGLSDVAAGTATLSEAARMWSLGDGTSFPMLPSGDSLADAEDLSGILVAEALDRVSERADLIFIDVPPVLWSSATPELGAHADGTILVVSDSADPDAVLAALSDLENAGAPVVGYVRNRSTGAHRMVPVWWRRAVVHAVAATLLLLTGFGLYTGAQLWYSWSRVPTETFDTSGIVIDDNQAAAPASEHDVVLESDEPPPANTPQTTAPEQAYETFLLIGGDEVSGAADVILYLVQPTNSAKPFMVSLPRDLYVENPCTGRNSRINALVHGCKAKDINGPSLLSYAVGQFTGIQVDHFARFDFDGFERIIDAVGGVEICVDNPVLDTKSKLSLPAGCTDATGAQALAWVRSRHTLEKINGSWKSVPGAGDLLRNQHQQDVILELFKDLKTFDSPTDLTSKVAGLADSFTLDSTLSITSAVGLAWSMREINLEDINRIAIPVRLTRSQSGQSIVVATASFDEVLADFYGGSLPTEDSPADESTAFGG
ncbi:MAG: LCP family protein [Actinomycetota bacterium]